MGDEAPTSVAEKGVDFVGIQHSDRFQNLKKRHRSFVFPVLGLALRHHGGGRRLLGLPLDDQRPGGVHTDGGALQLRLRLPATGRKFRRIHAGQHIARLHEVAFVDEDILDPPRRFRRDIDLDGLDAPVAARQPVRQRAVSGLPPGIEPADRKGREQEKGEPEPVAGHHDGIPSLASGPMQAP